MPGAFSIGSLNQEIDKLLECPKLVQEVVAGEPSLCACSYK